MPNKVLIDLDDYHWLAPENCLTFLESIIQIIPNCKLLLFTIPNLRDCPITQNNEWISRTISLIEKGNLRIELHGYTHEHLEFDRLNKTDTEKRIKDALAIFDDAGFPIPVAFKGPNWGICQNTIDVLSDMGFQYIYDHPKNKGLFDYKELTPIYYNWSIGDKLNPKPVTIGHGHTHNVCGNGIRETLPSALESIHQYGLSWAWPEDI